MTFQGFPLEIMFKSRFHVASILKNESMIWWAGSWAPHHYVACVTCDQRSWQSWVKIHSSNFLPIHRGLPTSLTVAFKLLVKVLMTMITDGLHDELSKTFLKQLVFIPRNVLVKLPRCPISIGLILGKHINNNNCKLDVICSCETYCAPVVF